MNLALHLITCTFIVIAIKCGNCQHDSFYLKNELIPKNFLHFSEENFNINLCHPGDYYIISEVLAYYVAYVAKYRGVTFDINCPVAVAAAQTFVHIKESNSFFWKRETGTIQMIFVNDELEYLITYLNSIDVVKMFNELIGVHGATMSAQTAIIAERFKDILINLDQRNKKELLLNLNGAIVYHDIFDYCGIHIIPHTSPLCELAIIANPKELVQTIERSSTIIGVLRTLSYNENVGSNERGYEFEECSTCWKYTFGCASLFVALPDDIHSIFVEAGYPNHHNAKFNCLALSGALTAEGIGVAKQVTGIFGQPPFIRLNITA